MDLREVISLLSEIIFFLKVCVKLAALSAEWPGRRKTYGPVFFFILQGHILISYWPMSDVKKVLADIKMLKFTFLREKKGNYLCVTKIV